MRRGRQTLGAAAGAELGVLALALIALGAPAIGQAQQLSDQRRQIIDIKAQIANLETDLREALDSSKVECIVGREVAGESARRCGGLEEKVSEGQILLELGDHERASIILYEAVETPGFDRSARYDDAVYALAEALLGTGNLVGARAYYQLLVQRGVRMYAQDAIRRLIEIGGRLNDYTDLDDYFDRYVKLSGGSVRPEIAYVRGKHLLLAGRVDEAISILRQIPRSNREGLRAAYLHAVALLTRGGDKATTQALELFQSVSDAAPRDDDEREVVELAHMACGRLYFEQNELERSSDAYQNISKDSAHFSEMLFEVTWTYIKRGQLLQDKPEQAKAQLRRAIQALDILLIAAPSSRMAPDIHILRGNLYQRLGDQDQAEAAFRGVIERYRPTLDQLEVLMAERGDARRLLEDILKADDADLTVGSLLPPLAARWAQGQEEIDDALRVYKEIRVSKDEVAAARKVVARLNRIVDAPNRVELFPSVVDVHTRGLTLRDRVLALGSAVADQQHALLPAAAAPEFREAVRRRQALQAKFDTIPRTSQGLETRVHRIEQRIDLLEKRLFKLSVALDSERAMLAAMNKYILDIKAAGELTPEADEFWKTNLGQARAAVDLTLEQHDALRARLRHEREALSVSGGPGSQELEIRAQLQAALEREAELLVAARAKASPEVRRQLEEIDSVSVELEGLRRRVEAFTAKLDGEVAERADMLRRAIAIEAGKLDTYERDVLRHEGEAGDVAANAAVLALSGVRDSFYDFVLRADVGVVDSAWQRKKQKSDEISRLMRRQRADLKALDQEFGEVLRSED